MEFKVGEIVYIKGFNECGAIKVVHENFIDKIIRYEVKTHNNEYTLLGRMLEPIDINLQHTQNLEQRIEKLEKEVFKPVEIHDRPKEKSLLTEDERFILRNLDKDFKFIARNTNGDLNVFEKCPKKREYFYSSFDWSLGGGSQSLDIFPNLFQFIKNTDEPYNIEELLKGECEE